MTSAVLSAAEPTVADPPTATPHLGTAVDLPSLLHRLGDVPPERVLMDPPPRTATEADAVRLREGEPKRLCELVFGTLVEKTAGEQESFLALELGSYTRPFARERDSGPVSGADGLKRMAGGSIRMPDVGFVRKERLTDGRIAPDAVGTAADLAAEVTSPSNTRRENEIKRHESFASGTRLMWEIDPAAARHGCGPTPTPRRRSVSTARGTASTCCRDSRSSWPTCSRSLPSRRRTRDRGS